MEIWKDKHAFTQHVLQLQNLPLESFLENKMQKLGANQRLKSGIFCVLECESAQVESGIQHLESGIHSVESRILYCPGVPYMGCNVIEIIM